MTFAQLRRTLKTRRFTLQQPWCIYDINAHGQRVRKTAFLHGACSPTINPDVFPTPSTPDEKNDAIEILLMDNRGKESAKQNANHVLESKTYTPTGELAGAISGSPIMAKVSTSIKRQSYDLLNRLVLIDLRRDNATQQLTAFQHNAFGETTADGPGGNGEIKELKYELKTTPSKLKSTPARSTSQWPVYQIDNAGRLTNTNDQKSPMVHFYDLSGAETAVLTSATMDLSVVTAADCA